MRRLRDTEVAERFLNRWRVAVDACVDAFLVDTRRFKKDAIRHPRQTAIIKGRRAGKFALNRRCNQVDQLRVVGADTFQRNHLRVNRWKALPANVDAVVQRVFFVVVPIEVCKIRRVEKRQCFDDLRLRAISNHSPGKKRHADVNLRRRVHSGYASTSIGS